MLSILPIMSFQGNAFTPGTASYDRANNIYATSTYGKERDMNPGEIYQPTGVEDIQFVIRQANKSGNHVPIAIRTGGHQYSGASSTNKNGIQLDLKPTFRRPKLDLQLIRENGKAYVRSSVSWTLMEFYDFLLDNQVFLPTGQCSTVCLGGHVQTGGYGMLARSFGLLADYIVQLEIVDSAGEVVKVTKTSNPDLFYGFLGGSPGNMGVLTHFKVEVQEDAKHQNSKGMWIAFKYTPETLKYMLDILVETSQNPEFPRNYDIGVNVVSRQCNLLDIFPGTEAELRKLIGQEAAKDVSDFLKFKFAMVVVYAQWVNFGGSEKYDSTLFDRIKAAPNNIIPFPIVKESEARDGMSKIASMWLFTGDREFKYPYVKRTNTTNSTTLKEDGWAAWFTGRVNELVSDKNNGLYISSQLQVMGGKYSMLGKNAGNGTAYSWRDSTVTGTWDAFYDGAQDKANEWQAKNDAGQETYFSKQDKRLLWGSYGEWDMKKVWQNYHEESTYKRLQQIKKKADPKGIFTPNPFCVEAAE